MCLCARYVKSEIVRQAGARVYFHLCATSPQTDVSAFSSVCPACLFSGVAQIEMATQYSGYRNCARVHTNAYLSAYALSCLLHVLSALAHQSQGLAPQFCGRSAVSSLFAKSTQTCDRTSTRTLAHTRTHTHAQHSHIPTHTHTHTHMHCRSSLLLVHMTSCVASLTRTAKRLASTPNGCDQIGWSSRPCRCPPPL